MGLRWDLFCRVIDNHGDLGVCWRLAADLADRGHAVALHVDDPRALAWMAPAGRPGVTVQPFEPSAAMAPGEVGDVVIEAFGCDPPPGFVDAMARRQPPPVWINLEYLSAEDYVGRSHGLLSPVAAAQPLRKWFFYPGFDSATGGLIREPGLLEARLAFERRRWLAERGIEPRPEERLVSLFCYPPPALDPWLDAWSEQPTLLLVTPGYASQALRGRPLPTALRSVELPWLGQPEYDRLLWSCDLNVVRGEDSLVRAIWAGAPFVWHIYPQHDGVHEGKLEALLARLLAGAGPALRDGIRAAMRHWNGFERGPVRLPALADWQAPCLKWRDELAAMPDLTSALVHFCTERQRPRC